MSGFKPSVIASVVLGLMTRMERFVGAILVIAAGVPKCFKWVSWWSWYRRWIF
jgi:hypothetical protein